MPRSRPSRRNPRYLRGAGLPPPDELPQLQLFVEDQAEEPEGPPEYYFNQVDQAGVPLRWYEPRPDLREDTAAWQSLLRRALAADRRLHGLLHCLRILGARIVDGSIVLPPHATGLVVEDYYRYRSQTRELLSALPAREEAVV